MEKLASDHFLKEKSDKNTYPIPRMLENFYFITETYNLLNEHIKLKIPIHSEEELLLDNYYAIEETVKNIEKSLSLKKYKNFLGIANGKKDNVTEELKANNQLEWAQKMNSIKSRGEEIILNEVIYQ